MKVSRNELKEIIRESVTEILNENVTNKVDNFDWAKQIVNLTDPDEFFYIQIMKRWKDNKDKGMVKKTDGTYHGGAEYGNMAAGTAFKVRNAQDIDAIEGKIKQYCDANNTRCYMVCNPRKQSEIDAFKPTYLSRMTQHNGGTAPNQAAYVDDILSGRPRSAKDWPDMRFFLDIDVPKNCYYVPKSVNLHTVRTNKGNYVVYDRNYPGLSQCECDRNPKCRTLYLFTDDPKQKQIIEQLGGINIWEGTHDILRANSIQVEKEYETPSRGLHVFIQQLSSVKNFAKLEYDLRIFDDGAYLGKNQTVHCNLDGKLILYSNVDTAGY